jgi:hypothetical protein
MPEFSDLLDDCLELLNTNDGSESVDPDDVRGPWNLELRVKSAQLDASAAKLAKFLQKRKVSRKARMRIARQYGPLEFSVAKSAAPDLASLLLEGEPELTARLYISIDGKVRNFDPISQGITDAVGEAGKVVEATQYKNGWARFAVEFADARTGVPSVAAILDVLRKEKAPRGTEVTLMLDTPLKPVPIYPRKG